MKQYEQLFIKNMCINCSARERDVVVSAFCGTGTEQLLKAEQAGPVPNCCKQCIHPQNYRSSHSQHQGPSFGATSALLNHVSLTSLQRMRNGTPMETAMELRKEHRKRSLVLTLLLSGWISVSFCIKGALLNDL